MGINDIVLKKSIKYATRMVIPVCLAGVLYLLFVWYEESGLGESLDFENSLL